MKGGNVEDKPSIQGLIKELIQFTTNNKADDEKSAAIHAICDKLEIKLRKWKKNRSVREGKHWNDRDI